MPRSLRIHARCAAAAAAAPFAFAGTERRYERSRPFLVRHLDLDVRLGLEEKSVEGSATLSFERVSPDARELALDAVGFVLGRVELDSGKGFRATSVDYDGDRIVVPIPAKAKGGRVRIQYGAVPRRGLYFLSPDDAVPDRPVQVWSQCQDEDARHWFPCHDKPHVKMTTALRVTVPPGFTALSNGELVKHSTGRRGATFHYRMTEPLPSYLVTLVAGKFDRIEDRAKRSGQDVIPLTYLVPEGREEDGRRTFAQTPRMIELFGKLTGVPFPFSRYSQVVVSDFIFGGMENTTATTMYEHILIDERASLDITSNDLIAHELAHHWFGDYVTCRDWSHAWLNEGFATYFEHVEREHRLGRDEYEHGVAGDADTYVSEARGRYSRPIVCRDYANPLDLFDRHLYEKGGLVLHMLRRDLGDELFFKGVNRYLSLHAHGIVETNDLMRAFEEVSGRSYERFFDQWVYRPGHPKLKVKVGWERERLTVAVEQTQKGHDIAVFAFSLEIVVVSKRGKVTRHEKWVDGRSDTLVVALPERPLWVGFDPDFKLIGEVAFEAPADMLQNQLAHGTTARLRTVAAEALKSRDDPKSIAALGAVLVKETEPWMVRAECARSLGHNRNDEGFRLLSAALRTRQSKVRRAVTAALGEFRTSAAASLLFPIAKKDPSYLVEAEAARSLGRTRRPEALERLVPLLDDSSWADVKRAAVLDGLVALRSEDGASHVLERTRYGIPARARRAAIAGLPLLSQSRRTREHLESLLDDADPHIRTGAVRALETLADPRARGALSRRLSRELDGRVTRAINEALRRLGDEGAAEKRRVNDELEELRREVSDLKRRLGKVEGGRGKARPAAGRRRS